MFGRKKKCPLGTIIFTDGLVTGFDQTGSEAQLRYTDYCGTHMVVRFVGVRQAIPMAGNLVRREVMDARFTVQGDHWLGTFLDDDGEPMLTIEFADGEAVPVAEAGAAQPAPKNRGD